MRGPKTCNLNRQLYIECYQLCWLKFRSTFNDFINICYYVIDVVINIVIKLLIIHFQTMTDSYIHRSVHKRT